MSIRRKLTFLLLIMTLVPLVVSRMVYAWISLDTSYRLANEMRQVLVTKAENSLLMATEDFSRLLDAKETNIGLIVRFQAERVERLLADAMLAQKEQIEPSLGSVEVPPRFKSRPFRGVTDAGTLEEVEDFGVDPQIFEDEIQEQARLSEIRIESFFQKDSESGVSYQKQHCFTLGSADTHRFELEELRTMTRDYFELNKLSRGAVLRQYTILESGVFVFYPFEPVEEGERGFDPRKIPIYQKVKESQTITSSAPEIDQVTGMTVVVVGMPLFYPDGRFAGMTAVDLITRNLFAELELPESDWQTEATAMLVKRLGPDSEAPGKIAVLEKLVGSNIVDYLTDVKEIRLSPEQTAARPERFRYLEVAEPQRLEEIVDQAEAGKSDIVEMPFNGRPSMWAYGPARTDGRAQEPFLIIVVPTDKVVEQAVKEKKAIIAVATREWWVTLFIFLALVLITAWIGVRSAKFVTRPVNQLAEAGIRLSEGDYHAHVEIHTKDELQHLAEVFNETGPKLLEREKMMHSLAMASEIQQQLLPQEPPVCEGLDVAGQSSYCDETGGDYFDYLLLPGDDEDSSRLGVAIGDVSGHGIGAALIMASVRSVLRSHAGEYQDRLDELMVLINRSFTDEADTGRFVTFCFSLFDPKQRTLRWVSAGHDPAFYVHRGEKGQKGTFLSIDELPNSGLPLGVVDDPDYEVMGPLELESGDLVLFGTDGIWETVDPGGSAFGKERLRQMLLDMHDQSADAIREAIIKAVTTFRGDGPQLDDVTLVVVKVC